MTGLPLRTRSMVRPIFEHIPWRGRKANGRRDSTRWCPKIVALDIDGTLVRAGGLPSERVKVAVAKAECAGSQVMVTTGRSLAETKLILEELGLVHGLAICSNGAVVARASSGAVVKCCTFDARPVINRILSKAPTAIIAAEDSEGQYMVTTPFPDGELHAQQVQRCLDELLEEPVARVIIRDINSSADDFIELASRLDRRDVSYSVGFKAWLDLGPAHISKGTALSEIARSLGIPADDCLAIGDGRNDLEMLQWAGRGVAMGHAPCEVKCAADSVTLGVDQDGAAVELERWFSK